jgi:hypothetical protein
MTDEQVIGMIDHFRQADQPVLVGEPFTRAELEDCRGKIQDATWERCFSVLYFVTCSKGCDFGRQRLSGYHSDAAYTAELHGRVGCEGRVTVTARHKAD